MVTDDTVLYFGSHNLSQGAWGNVEKNGTQLSTANWELGVAFVSSPASKEFKQRIVDLLPL